LRHDDPQRGYRFWFAEFRGCPSPGRCAGDGNVLRTVARSFRAVGLGILGGRMRRETRLVGDRTADSAVAVSREPTSMTEEEEPGDWRPLAYAIIACFVVAAVAWFVSGIF
jgi:hypothetical protein